MASVFDWIYVMRRVNRNKCRGALAPHKPVLLLAVMAEIERGTITNCYVPLSDHMKRAFEEQWRLHVGRSPHFNPAFATPFYHMCNEGFWELMPRPGRSPHTEWVHTPSLKQLRDNYYGAYINASLFACMSEPGARALLRRALLEAYFPESISDSSPRLGSIAADSGNGESAVTNCGRNVVRA